MLYNGHIFTNRTTGQKALQAVGDTLALIIVIIAAFVSAILGLAKNS